MIANKENIFFINLSQSTYSKDKIKNQDLTGQEVV